MNYVSNRGTAPPQINLSRRPCEPPLNVSMEAFFEFTFWLAEELLDLEAQYRTPLKPEDRGIGTGGY